MSGEDFFATSIAAPNLLLIVVSLSTALSIT